MHIELSQSPDHAWLCFPLLFDRGMRSAQAPSFYGGVPLTIPLEGETHIILPYKLYILNLN